jgi:DNA-binding transcriptional MerR regulator
MSTPQDLMQVGPAAQSLGVSVDTLRRLGRLGHLTEYRDHRNVRHYRRRDIEQLRRDRMPRVRRHGRKPPLPGAHRLQLRGSRMA